MKLSLFSVIGGTFYQFNDVPITEETLRQFEEEVGSKVTEKLSTMAPLLPSFIKITPELVVSEEHNGDVMVKDIILETKETGERSTLLQRAVDTWGRFARVDMAIEALEKQIPKETRLECDGLEQWLVCPSCGDTGVEDARPYCKECGQAIDWSEFQEA